MVKIILVKSIVVTVISVTVVVLGRLLLIYAMGKKEEKEERKRNWKGQMKIK